MTKGRFLGWLAVGAAAVAAVMLKDAGSLLGDIQSAGMRSYGAGVFTGPRVDVFDTTALGEAIGLWRTAQDSGVNIERILAWHLAVDALLFVPALAAIVRTVLLRVAAQPWFAAAVAGAYFVLDEVETLVTAVVLVGFDLEVTNGPWLVLVQTLASLKWLALAVGAVALVGLWRRPEGASFAGFAEAVGRARRGGRQTPALALAGLIVLVGLFVALVALPAGGALDQLPDVIREHFSDGSFGLWALSTLGFLLFLVAVVVAGLAATSPGGARARDATLSTRSLLVGTFVASAALCGLAFVVDGEFRLAPWTPFLVVGVLAAVAWVARVACIAAEDAPPEPEEDGSTATWTPSSVLWVGGLAGAVGIASAIGMVRGAFPPLVLDVGEGRFPWGLATAIGVVGSVLAGAVFQWAVVRLVETLPATAHRTVAVGTVAVVGLVAGWLAAAPSAGEAWGSTGVIGVSLAAWSLLVGLLTWLSRTRPRWDVTRLLGFGRRTPWLTLLAVTWVVAGMLDSEGGYHDARVLADADGSPRYESLDDAFDSWRIAVDAACAPASGERVPMVFAAAPGGGIRGAYWTVSVLERLFPRDDDCAPARLFALSGVSGGSVGSATWVSAAGAGKSPLAAITAMSEDDALPRALAGLLLRDLPQPLTGINTGWEDRAALFEQGWAEATGVFGTGSEPAPWAEAGDGGGLDFVPVMSLNGSSVTDACRVVVTNAGSLPATLGPDCQAAPGPGSLATGPVSGAIDPFVGLHDRDVAEAEECDGSTADVPVTTAALLSARFPVVSPPGGILRCVSGEETASYVVDGGYYENSGLLTLLQMWQGLEDAVREHNQAAALPRGLGPLGTNPIDPWIVVVDNHYRATGRRVTPGRSVTMPAIVQARLQNVLTQPMLEQIALWEMSGEGIPRFVRIAPAVNPGVEAPLGWVLSSPSRENLRTQLEKEIDSGDPNLDALLDALGISS